MISRKWFVIGISGATCSGKSTLAKKIHDSFSESVMLRQDDYFLPENDPRHTRIPELNHMNWELITSLDMQKMYSDIMEILQINGNVNDSKKKLLILDGFLLFKHNTVTDLCNRKYFLTLTKQQCWERRKDRIYEPPDVPEYFDTVVWPEYLKYKDEITKHSKLCETVTFIDGSKNENDIFEIVFKEINQLLS